MHFTFLLFTWLSASPSRRFFLGWCASLDLCETNLSAVPSSPLSGHWVLMTKSNTCCIVKTDWHETGTGTKTWPDLQSIKVHLTCIVKKTKQSWCFFVPLPSGFIYLLLYCLMLGGRTTLKCAYSHKINFLQWIS